MTHTPESLKPLYIFDIDGTIADLAHRLHLVQGKTKDWVNFYDKCIHDEPIQPTINLMDTLRESGNEIWHFTGRIERIREGTDWWLSTYTAHFDAPIVMRADGDTRPDYIVKQEMLDNMLLEDRDRIVGVFDDRQQVVDMWRKNNIKCYQVAKGDF